MKRTMLVIAAALGLIFGSAGSVQAVNVAGWDFSQYAGDGLRTTDGSTFPTTLDANYSSLDPTHNAGTEAATFGEAMLSATVLPNANGLSANLGGSASAFGENSFDAHNVLAAEGQTYTEYLGITTQSAATVVFKADLTSIADSGWGWSVSFAGKTLSGTSSVDVEFSTDGSSYTSYGSVPLTTDEAAFDVTLTGVTTDEAYVRLSLDPSLGQPIIDNVAVDAIYVPEPGMALQLAAGVVGLLTLARRRS